VLDAVKATLDSPSASILLTADRTEETAAKATAAGARIMNKPVRPAALRALMSALKRG
jgi:DNA-binding response OmpR family regulator